MNKVTVRWNDGYLKVETLEGDCFCGVLPLRTFDLDGGGADGQKD